MTTPARYWRVYFRAPSVGSAWNQYTIGFASMRWFDAAGTELSSGLLAAALSTTAPQLNTTSYPLINLVDSNQSTHWVVNYGASVVYNYVQNWYYVQFDFGTAVLPDHVRINIVSTNYGGSRLGASSLDFIIDSSPDNITYYRQTMQYRPIQLEDTEVRLAASPFNVIYPLPPKDNYGGSGGIYGIVSEDGVALPDRPVILLERDTFYKIGWTNTDINGGYAFNGLNTQREFMVMSYDPSGPPYKNALIWDRITPINTLGNIATQSAFWARRTRDLNLGGLVSPRDYLDGGTYNFMVGNTVGNLERRWAAYPDLMNFAPASAVGGSIKFLKSGRTPTNTSEGIAIKPSMGLFTGVNAAGIPANYQNLTFEYIFIAPTGSEAPMYIVWSGTRDSDDANMYDADPFVWGQAGWGAGPTLEITPAGAVNVRFPLGARNRATVRATATITPGNMYHVMVTYAQDTAIKLYVDGALIQTTSISGAGRLWGHVIANSSSNAPTTFENWDYIVNGGQGNAAIRRLHQVCVAGNGSTVNNSGTLRSSGPGFGGAIGLVALYNRTFSDSEVATFYDSFVNWDTHAVLPTQSGYAGEVEADNPVLYSRLNDLVSPVRISSQFGSKDYQAVYEGAPVFNAAGFVSGQTSVTVSNGGAYFINNGFNSIFSVECFVRPTSVAGTQRIWLTRIYNGNPPAFLSMVSGVLRLNIYDITGTDTLIQFSQTLVINTAYHIVVTYDPWYDKQCKLYINGALVQTLTATTIPAPDSYWTGVGVNVSGTGPSVGERFQGQIGEFAVYNYVLPAARIQAHYDARNA